MPVTREEMLQCSLPRWYEKFKEITIKTVLIDLSEEFVDYLNSDGCFLPQNCSLPSHNSGTCSDSDSEQEDWGEDDDEGDTAAAPSFPELTEKIKSAIELLGGAVMPKLNWSSPRDATWIAPDNSMRCTCVAEVILLLKSSDFISHDLSRVFEYCGLEDSTCLNADEEERSVPMKNGYTLCLRKWISIHPSSEFRCFVNSHQLVAISQRCHHTYYRHLVEHREEIRREVTCFYENNIARKFPCCNYVFDVFRVGQDKFLLIDFNPYCPATDPLLYSWEELAHESEKLLRQSDRLLTSHTMSSSCSTDCSTSTGSGLSCPGDGSKEEVTSWPLMRVVDGQSIQPSDLQSFRLPKDIVDLSSGEDIDKFVDLFKSGHLTQGN